MKKFNVICAAIAILAGASANAGVLSSAVAGGTRFAVEIFGNATTNLTSVTPGAVTYTILTTNGIVINPNGKIYLTIRLADGAFQDNAGAATAPAVGTITGSGLTIAGFTGSVGAGVVSSDGTTVTYPITYGTGVTLGAGSTFVYTPAAGDIRNVKTALSVVGGTVTASVGLSSLAGSATPNSALPVPADIDGPTAVSTAIAQSINGVSVATAATGANTAGVVQKIDLTATPAGSVYTSQTNGTTAIAKLGEVRVTLPAATVKADGSVLTVVDYSAVGASLAITATPNAGRSFPVAASGAAPIGRVFAVVGPDCAAAPAASTVLLTSVTAAAAVNLSVSATDLATAMAALAPNTGLVSVCQGSAGGAAITPITPTLAAVATPATALANYATDSGSGTGFALDYNGSVVDVTTYWPGALDAFGYLGYVRITNTGAINATVSAQHINPDTGAVTGAPVAIVASLAAGQSVLLSTKTIDSTTLGAAPSGLSSGRLRLTAPTNGLRVQSLLQIANTAPIEYNQTP